MMMNNILRNLINTGEIASFIDDMIIGTEEKEEYNKVIDEVVKMLEENDLYMKQEKFIICIDLNHRCHHY